jgi:hypothetical protein
MESMVGDNTNDLLGEGADSAPAAATKNRRRRVRAPAQDDALEADVVTTSTALVGEVLTDSMLVGDNTKATRSPLLPVRHQPDFFVCDIFDAAMKGDAASMEHPIFSLSKKPDLKIRRYENGEKWVEVRPSTKGLATIFDRDILIYCISQLVAAMNAGRPISRTLHLRAHDLMVATNRDSSGRGYLQLREALERLQGTQIVTNLTTGGKETTNIFSLVKEAQMVKETWDGRLQEVTIELSNWVFRAVEAQEVLTLDKRYFQLAKPLERRLYELARKHVGLQPLFKIGLEKLRVKTGSQSTLKEFKRLLQAIIKDDEVYAHMPGYTFALVGDVVEMRPKTQALQLSLLPPAERRQQLSAETYEEARALAPGWDIYGLEAEWRDWLVKRKITPRNAERHFMAFCKRRGRYPGFA